MYASVIPAVKLPRGMDSFDYAIPEELMDAVGPGSLVTMPWRGRRINGVVRAVRATPAVHAARIKPLEGLSTTERLPDDLLRTIEWMSGHCFVSPGTVVNAFLPAAPKRKRIAETPPTIPSSAPSSADRRVIRYASAEERDAMTHDAARRCLSAGRSVIVVAPHLDDVAGAASRMRGTFGEDAVIELHGELAAGRLWESWRRILSGRPLIAVGTRMAVMAPAPRLGAIIIHESDSPDLKQYDQNPRFDARRTALFRADAAGCELLFMSHAPRAEEFALIAERGFALHDPSRPTSRTMLVDLSGGRSGDEDTLLSPAAASAIENALHERKKVLIFHNRRGTAGALVCRDCGRVFRCATCGIAMKPHDGTLHCHRCGTKVSIPLACPECRGASLRMIGTGVAAFETMLKKRFPAAATARRDADAREPVALEADILIGTQLLVHDVAEHGTDGRAFGAVVATSIDDLIEHPGFRVGENAWRTVRTLKDIADQSGGECILQTIDPENPRIRSLLGPYASFMNAEFEERGLAGYAPAVEMVALTVSNATSGEAHARAAELRGRLAAAIVRETGVRVSGPYASRTPFRHGTWRSVITIRTPKVSPALATFLASLPESVIIDRDPEELS